MVQLSHLYMTPGKTRALTIRIFVGKVMSLLFNMLSRLVIAFLPNNKHLLILWLRSQSSVILEPMNIKSATLSAFPQLFTMKWWYRMPFVVIYETIWSLKNYAEKAPGQRHRTISVYYGTRCVPLWKFIRKNGTIFKESFTWPKSYSSLVLTSTTI